MRTQKSFNRKTIARDTMIFQEGDVANYAYLLKSGRVEITVYKGGKHVLLTTIMPNQLFGELALIDQKPRSATAIAVEPSEVIVVKPDDLHRHLDGLDEFMKYWVAYLTDRIRDLSKRVEDWFRAFPGTSPLCRASAACYRWSQANPGRHVITNRPGGARR
ncbi:MAG: cyclic nucleotide-binding domain-containing protein [Rhodospirillaceae bacterium]